MTENEFLLQDRIAKIKSINEKHNLEDNAYLSFSGGKDSTVLHHLLDEALPNNQIPRVYIDTGIEYDAVRLFVKKMAQSDSRIHIVKPSKNIKTVLETQGYPFKSKHHSHMLSIYQHSGIGKSVARYLHLVEFTTKIHCPKKLEYQFTETFSIKISDKCCTELKKKPARKWEKDNNRHIAIIGVRTDEGGIRMSHPECVVFDSDGTVKKFKPLNPVSNEWEEWYITERKIALCELYYSPYNFKRTGCKGCPFALDLQAELDTMSQLLPNEKQQCEIIWKPVYDEYKRIGYRLRPKGLFD